MKARFIVAIFLIFLCTYSHAKLKTWSLYTSENFAIYTDAKEKKATEILKEFELFREAIISITGIDRKPENQRLVVMMYSNGKEFNKVKPSKNIIGFYTSSDAGPRMIIGPGRTSESSAVLYHEYVHYLLREHTNMRFAKWYDEGFAELLAATTIKGRKITVGAIPEERLYPLRAYGKLAITDLVDPDPDRDSTMFMGRFYATAWLFAHYLQISPYQTNSDLRIQTAQFNQLYNNGVAPIDALTQAFGMTPREIDVELDKYQKQRRFAVLKMEIEPYAGSIQKRELTSNERAFVLAELAWRVGKEDYSLEYLQNIDPTSADAARGLSLLAVLENHKDNIGAATSARNQALRLTELDTQVLSNIAHHDLDSYNRSAKQGTPDSELLQHTVHYSQLAIDQDPANGEAYRFHWQALQTLNQPIEAVKSMMMAYQLEPGSIGINATIGNYLVELSEPKLARPFIERVYNWSHSDEQQTWAKEILDKIDIELANAHEEQAALSRE